MTEPQETGTEQIYRRLTCEHADGWRAVSSSLSRVWCGGCEDLVEAEFREEPPETMAVGLAAHLRNLAHKVESGEMCNGEIWERLIADAPIDAEYNAGPEHELVTDGGQLATESDHSPTVDRRYICRDCDSVVRARWGQHGDAYPGYFSVGCECTTVPVVPQMSQAETPDAWRVERPSCCAGVEASDLETVYGNQIDAYRCGECGATYRHDGTMSTAPDSEPEERQDGQQPLLTDGGDVRDCPKCHGTGVRYVYDGPHGGSVECEMCDGGGKVSLVSDGGQPASDSDQP